MKPFVRVLFALLAVFALAGSVSPASAQYYRHRYRRPYHRRYYHRPYHRHYRRY